MNNTIKRSVWLPLLAMGLLTVFFGCQDTKPSGRRLGGRSTSIMKDYLSEFHTIKQIETKFTELQKKPPAVGAEKLMATTGFLSTTKTVCGNQIRYVTITNSVTATKKVKGELGEEVETPVVKADMLFVSGQHMDEHVPPEVMMSFFDQMSGRFTKDKAFREALKYVNIHIVPIVNVDTKLYLERRASGILDGSQTIDAKFGPWDIRSSVFRKNMNRGKQKCKAATEFTKGVDLNRNYPANWNDINNIIKEEDRLNEKRSSGPEDLKYPGIGPQSEVEVRSMVKFIKGLNKLVFMLDLHDKLGPEIERGLCTAGCQGMEKLLKEMKFYDGTKAIGAKKLVSTETESMLPGLLQNYGIRRNVSHVYTIEIGTQSFPSNTTYITENEKLISASFFAMVQEIASEAKQGAF